MTVTRYPGNPDFHDVPPRCAGCGQFCGGFESSNPVVWERQDNWDLPDTYVARCLGCSVERVQEQHDLDEQAATEEMLAAISGGAA